MKDTGNVAVVTMTDVTGFSLGDLAGASLSPATRKIVSGVLIGAFVLIAVSGGLIVYRRRRMSNGEENE